MRKPPGEHSVPQSQMDLPGVRRRRELGALEGQHRGRPSIVCLCFGRTRYACHQKECFKSMEKCAPSSFVKPYSNKVEPHTQETWTLDTHTGHTQPPHAKRSHHRTDTYFAYPIYIGNQQRPPHVVAGGEPSKYVWRRRSSVPCSPPAPAMAAF